MNEEPVRVGLLGCGTVGAALVELIAAESPTIAARTGLELRIVRVAVRDLQRSRAVNLPRDAFTDDAAAVVADPDIDVIVEVMGGVDDARAHVLDALARGKPVVTANKELLATHGAELFAAADVAGVDLLFEAAVAGGIPIVRPMRESLLGERIVRVMGILNGTTNYILTKMTEEGAPYAAALVEAQQFGYAEADPTADVEGHDAGAKLAILASIAFGVEVTGDDVHLEGITQLTEADISFASRNGYVIKLLAIGERLDEPSADEPPGTGTARVAVHVHPALVPLTHPLASVRDSFNAVFVEGAAVGELMFYGRGAGGGPTASAVLGDLVDAATNRRKGSSASLGALGEASIEPVSELISDYYVHIEVLDAPGVLAAVAGVFGSHGVSIRSVIQEGQQEQAGLAFITHHAREADLRATLSELHDLDAVRRIGSVIRLVGDGPL